MQQITKPHTNKVGTYPAVRLDINQVGEVYIALINIATNETALLTESFITVIENMHGRVTKYFTWNGDSQVSSMISFSFMAVCFYPFNLFFKSSSGSLFQEMEHSLHNVGFLLSRMAFHVICRI